MSNSKGKPPQLSTGERFAALTESLLSVSDLEAAFKWLGTLTTLIPQLASSGAAAGGVIAAGTITASWWPAIALLPLCGLTWMKCKQRLTAAKSEAEVREILVQILAEHAAAKTDHNRQLTGQHLAADWIAAAEQIAPEDIDREHLGYPQLVMYHFLKGRFATAETLQHALLKGQSSIARQLRSSLSLQREVYAAVLQQGKEARRQTVELRTLRKTITEELSQVRKELAAKTVSPQPLLDLPLFAYDIESTSRFLFSTQRVPLVGRERELKDLQEFIASENELEFSWWCCVAPAGFGKSRIGLELCLWAEEQGYTAGFLPRHGDGFDWSDWRPTAPTFIVIDYVADRIVDTRRLLGSLSTRCRNGRLGFPMRVLLLERASSDRRDASAPSPIGSKSLEGETGKTLQIDFSDLWWKQLLGGGPPTRNRRISTPAVIVLRRSAMFWGH